MLLDDDVVYLSKMFSFKLNQDVFLQHLFEGEYVCEKTL